jgi:predicted ArsR family transcriptional regulator
MPGLTTSQVAQMLGISQDGARKMMSKLEAGHDVPIVSVDGRWQLVPYRLREAYRPITA